MNGTFFWKKRMPNPAGRTSYPDWRNNVQLYTSWSDKVHQLIGQGTLAGRTRNTSSRTRYSDWKDKIYWLEGQGTLAGVSRYFGWGKKVPWPVTSMTRYPGWDDKVNKRIGQGTLATVPTCEGTLATVPTCEALRRKLCKSIRWRSNKIMGHT